MRLEHEKGAIKTLYQLRKDVENDKQDYRVLGEWTCMTFSPCGKFSYVASIEVRETPEIVFDAIKRTGGFV